MLVCRSRPSLQWTLLLIWEERLIQSENLLCSLESSWFELVILLLQLECLRERESTLANPCCFLATCFSSRFALQRDGSPMMTTFEHISLWKACCSSALDTDDVSGLR